MTARQMRSTFLSVFPSDLSGGEKGVFIAALLLFVSADITALAVNQLWIALLPLGLILFYLLTANLSIVLYLIVIVFPLSIPLAIPGAGTALQFPTEPIILLLIPFWMLQMIVHPVEKPEGWEETARINFWLIFFLCVLMVSVVTSTYPGISAKFFINTLWWVISCYLFVRYEMRERKDLTRLLWLFVLVSDFVVLYTLVRMAGAGFSEAMAGTSFKPFFREHGTYAAYVTIIFSLSLGAVFAVGKRRGLRLFLALTSFLMFLGVVFSFTRAAWLAIAGVLLFFGMVKARELLKVRTFIVLSVVVLALTTFAVREGVVYEIERHATSITNVEDNISNLERISRWAAAVNIIEAHPLLGVGWGAYPNQYQNYRNPMLTTPISYIHALPHNDYLEYFSETGVFGLLSWLMFMVYFFVKGVRNYFLIQDEFMRNLLLGCMGGVLSYEIHAMFNDFLQYDKVAVPFWISIAIAVIIMEQGRAARKKELINRDTVDVSQKS